MISEICDNSSIDRLAIPDIWSAMIDHLIAMIFFITFIIYHLTNVREETDFYVPATAVVSVFVIIFLSMLHGRQKQRKENLIEALRNETA